MTRNQLLSHLSFLDEAGVVVGIELYFILNIDGTTVIKFAELDSEVLAPKLKTQFVSEIKNIFVFNQRYSLLNIDNADEDRANTFYYFNEAQLTDELRIIKEFDESEIEYETFSPTNDDVKTINGFFIKISNDQHKVLLYKKHYPFNLLKKDTFLKIFPVPNSNRLQLLDENVINLDEKFSFMYINSKLIVISMAVLERNFKYSDVIEQKALNNIPIIQAANLIENVDKLRELVHDKAMAKKLMRVNADSPVLNLPTDKILKFIKRHPKLKGQLRLNEGKTQILLDTKKSMILLVKLLNDDYLKSYLTKRDYDSLSKDPIAPEVEEQ